MTSLIGENSKDRWYPNDMTSLRNFFRNYQIDETKCKYNKNIISNICYNLQYIEYLNKTLNDLNLSEVLIQQTIKSFIMTSMAIIEAVFYVIYCNQGYRKTTNLVKISSTGLQQFKINDDIYKIENVIYKVVDEVLYEPLYFQKIINKIQKKNILSVDNKFFIDLNVLRKLRNKIHLQDESLVMSDYFLFDKTKLLITKECMYNLLIDPIFNTTKIQKDMFHFLK